MGLIKSFGSDAPAVMQLVIILAMTVGLLGIMSVTLINTTKTVGGENPDVDVQEIINATVANVKATNTAGTSAVLIIVGMIGFAVLAAIAAFFIGKKGAMVR